VADAGAWARSSVAESSAAAKRKARVSEFMEQARAGRTTEGQGMGPSLTFGGATSREV
jgi:hypothetical protein